MTAADALRVRMFAGNWFRVLGWVDLACSLVSLALCYWTGRLAITFSFIAWLWLGTELKRGNPSARRWAIAAAPITLGLLLIGLLFQGLGLRLAPWGLGIEHPAFGWGAAAVVAVLAVPAIRLLGSTGRRAFTEPPSARDDRSAAERPHAPTPPANRILLLLLCATTAHADFSADAVPIAPDILTRLIAGAECSGHPLQSHVNEGESTVYFLRRAEYIGECPAPFGTVHIARLFYIRSGTRAHPAPPPRGHSFVVFYDSKFRVRGHWRDPGGPYRISGTKLLEGDREIFDYAHLPKETETGQGHWPHPPIWK